MIDKFRDPENGKMYSFVGPYCFELDEQTTEVESRCSECGAFYAPSAGHECRLIDWPGSWREIISRWRDF